MKIYQVAIITKPPVTEKILVPPVAILAADEKSAANKVLLDYVAEVKAYNLDNVEVVVVPFA